MLELPTQNCSYKRPFIKNIGVIAPNCTLSCVFYKELVANRPIYNIMGVNGRINMENTMSKMDRKIFKETMLQLWEDIDIIEAWDTYNETMESIERGMEEVELLSMLSDLTKEQRLIWRTELAERGYEMTPIQIDQYISIVEIALGV